MNAQRLERCSSMPWSESICRSTTERRRRRWNDRPRLRSSATTMTNSACDTVYSRTRPARDATATLFSSQTWSCRRLTSASFATSVVLKRTSFVLTLFPLSTDTAWLDCSWCDGVTRVTRKPLRNASRGRQPKNFQDSLSHAVTPSHGPLIVFPSPESNAQPNANLLGLPPAVESHSIPSSAELLQALIEGVFGERIFVTYRVGPG